MRGKILLFMVSIFLIASVSALDIGNQERLDFGHVIVLKNLSTNPSTIEPGVPSTFELVVDNSGDVVVKDIRVGIKLPSEVGFFNDVSEQKIAVLPAGSSKKVIFNLIALPGSTEGVYMVNVTVDYVNHIGEERQDSYNSGIVIKSKPKMYVQIEEADVYKGKNTGEITVKFVNNDVADIKFLTAELMESEKYTILSPKRVYVGDLDSDDFESIDYRIKVKKKSGEILIPLKIEYKDSMNNPITGEVSAVLTMYNGGDIGKTTSNTSRNIIIFLIVVGGGYWFYKRWKKKRKKKY